MTCMKARTVASHIERVAATLGIAVHVTEGDVWDIIDGQVRLGTGRYDLAGLRGDSLVASVMLDLWASVRLPRSSHTRTTHRLSLTRDRPELSPLLDTIDRIQAGAELVHAFPGFREPLSASLEARFPRNLAQAPEPAQWLAMTLLDALAPGRKRTVTDPVFQERIDPQLLHRAMDPMLPPNPQHTFARLVSVLAPPYLNLLGRLGVGLGERGTQPTEEPRGTNGDPLPQTSAEDATEQAEPSEAGGEATRHADTPHPERDTGTPEPSPGLEPDETTGAAAVEHMLALPLPAHRTTAGTPELDTEPSTPHHAQVPAIDAPNTHRTQAEQQVRLSAYLDRVARLEPEITRVRDLWQQLISEQLHVHHGWDRTPQSEGEELHRTALPAAIAEARAGVPRPRAYTRRNRRLREREGFGNTDIAFLVDRSGSMRSARHAATDAVLVMTEALAAVTRDVRDIERWLGVNVELTIRTSFIVFDSDPVVIGPLSATVSDDARARFIAESLRTQGGTHDAAALEEAARQLEVLSAPQGHRTPRRRLVVMISDGGSQEPDRAAATLQYLRDRGVTVFGVSVQSDALAQRYAPDARRVDDPGDIVRVLETLIIEAAAPGRRRRATV